MEHHGARHQHAEKPAPSGSPLAWDITSYQSVWGYHRYQGGPWDGPLVTDENIQFAPESKLRPSLCVLRAYKSMPHTFTVYVKDI